MQEWKVFAKYMLPPAAFSLAAMAWLSGLTDAQMAGGTYPVAMGAVMLGMGLTLIAAHVAVGKIRPGREGQA